MYNIRPVVFEQLKKIKDINAVISEYPSDFTKLPLISFFAADNSDSGKCSREVLTNVTIQVDVWSLGNPYPIAEQVQKNLTEVGLRQKTAVDMADGNINRISMRYSAVINNRTNYVFH